jgi:hypothetical protein
VFGCTRLGQTGYGTFQEFVSELNLNKEEESKAAC